MIPFRHKFLVTEIDLCAWLSQATPNDALEYHRGFLVLDVDAHINRLANNDRLELIQLASRARWAAARRLVHLVQRRLGGGGGARRAALATGPDNWRYLDIAERASILPDRRISRLI
jgi:hypothetical protein